MSELPREVIAEDHKLESTSSKAAEALMELRWHWTLDESNSDRVGVVDYARAVGRSHSIISRDAKAYELVRRGTATDEARERANMGAETVAATEAVAKMRGISLQQARKTRPTEVKRVRQIARERVEKQGGTIEEQTEKAADWIVKSEQAHDDITEQRRQKIGLRFVEMEGLLVKAKKPLLEALTLARTVEWDDEPRELLSNTVENIKALLTLIDVALVDAANVDWDAELEKLTKEVT
jgi:hypothetical protein